jgi:hypothetical protein
VGLAGHIISKTGLALLLLVEGRGKGYNASLAQLWDKRSKTLRSCWNEDESA